MPQTVTAIWKRINNDRRKNGRKPYLFVPARPRTPEVNASRSKMTKYYKAMEFRGQVRAYNQSLAEHDAQNPIRR